MTVIVKHWLTKGSWTKSEDEILVEFVKEHHGGQRGSNYGNSGHSRLRMMKLLRPNPTKMHSVLIKKDLLFSFMETPNLKDTNNISLTIYLKETCYEH